MGLPSASWLDPDGRDAFDARCRALNAGLRMPSALAERPVPALLVSAVLGTSACVLEAGLLIASAVESAVRARRGRALLGVPRALLGLVAGVLLHGLGKLLSALQTAVGLEPPGRRLTLEEQALLRFVFHDALDLEPLRIKSGHCGLASLTHRPFVHGEVLYLKRWPLEPAILVHEAVHWWQSQHGGPDYMLDSLWSQAFGRGYAWRPSVPGVAWRDLETEQQAALVEAMFRAGYFETGRFVEGGADLTLVARAALSELRAGRGAP
jgi:hypothetical protein